MELITLGWNDSFAQEFEQINANQGYKVGRIAAKYQDIYKIYAEDGEVLGRLGDRMLYNHQLPVVGDWVIISSIGGGQNVIEQILTRQSTIPNNILGNSLEKQILASNIDTIFIMISLAQEINLRSIQRQITLVWESGSTPVIVLSKADLCDDAVVKKNEVELISFGTPVYIISMVTKEGVDDLKKYLKIGKTCALLGSVSAGKSTLANYLYTQKREINLPIDDMSINSKMSVLDEGGVIIEINSITEVEPLSSEESNKENFEDIEELAQGCYFSDCRHEAEPKCAVKEAIEEGILDELRLKNYKKLQKEAEYIEFSKDHSPKEIEKSKWKQITKASKDKERMKEKVMEKIK